MFIVVHLLKVKLFLIYFTQGAASAPWVAKGLKKIHHTAPFITMGTLAFVSSLLMCWLPETKDRKTVETLHDVEKSEENIESVELVTKA